MLQVKYRESGMAEISSSLYCLLPQTSQTQLARELSDMQSEVRTHGGMDRMMDGWMVD